MTPDAQGDRPPEPAESTPAPESEAPQANAAIPAQPSVFSGENDATVKVVPGAAPQPVEPQQPAPSPSPVAVPQAAPSPAAAPRSAFESGDDFLTESRPPAVAPQGPAPAAPPSAMPQTTLPSPAPPPAQGYAMTPPPMAPGVGSPVGPPPPVMQTGPMPLPMAPRKPRNKAAITFGLIALVLLAGTTTFGILYSEKTNDFDAQAEQLAAVEAEREELKDEIVALQLERDTLQLDSDARQACSDALDILIDDEYTGTVDSFEDLASPEYQAWAEAHDELYREVERQCLA
jgi:hypothetical protein